MYRVHETSDFVLRYLITRNDYPVWATITIPGARRWIARDRARRNKAVIPVSRKYPVVHEEE